MRGSRRCLRGLLRLRGVFLARRRDYLDFSNVDVRDGLFKRRWKIFVFSGFTSRFGNVQREQLHQGYLFAGESAGVVRGRSLHHIEQRTVGIGVKNRGMNIVFAAGGGTIAQALCGDLDRVGGDFLCGSGGFGGSKFFERECGLA